MTGQTEVYLGPDYSFKAGLRALPNPSWWGGQRRLPNKADQDDDEPRQPECPPVDERPSRRDESRRRCQRGLFLEQVFESLAGIVGAGGAWLGLFFHCHAWTVISTFVV